jgi:multidrug resistance efflux pump
MTTPPTSTPQSAWYTKLVAARVAMDKAAADTTMAADELRRYQKFARPGQPSAHTVQLRQKQAAARQASAQARQAFLKAAMEVAREAGLTPPPRVSLESFMRGWMDAQPPA